MGLKGQQFSTAASIFYVGYLVAQAPWAYLIGRYPAGKVLGVSTVIWGVVSSSSGCSASIIEADTVLYSVLSPW
jgi:MFS family permease